MNADHNDDHDDEQTYNTLILQYQFKVNAFCAATIFMAGNGIYLVAKNQSIQRTLLAILDQWNEHSSKIPLMIEVGDLLVHDIIVNFSFFHCRALKNYT